MSEFLQHADREIRRHNLFSRGQKILVAVSGGADSMVLLQVLNSLALENRWKISVAHFNHHLRGCASEGDEKLVRRLAQKLQLPFFVEGADVATFADQSKISIEMAARKLRHEFLARIARAQRLTTIALAHHADDQVELFFVRLLRGAGSVGLAGMKRSSPSPVDKKITLVRPMLGFSKAEILAHAHDHRISFREDASNSSSQFLRNRIRNELLPLLKRDYQPGVAGNVLRLMEIIGAESELSAVAARQWRKIVAADRAGSDFTGLPLAVQRRILQEQLIELGVATDFDLIEQLRAAAEKFVSVGSDFAIARDTAGQVRLRRSSPDEFNFDELNFKVSDRAGRVKFGGGEYSWQIEPCAGALRSRRPAKRSGFEMFDADKIGPEIILRHWRAGDRFQPIGLASPAKLQDLFVNAKIPASRRRRLVLAATKSGEIFWVESLRIGERFKLTPATRRRWVGKWLKNNQI